MSENVKLDLLRGTIDETNSLITLRANPLVWSSIFADVNSYYEKYIDKTSVAYLEDCVRYAAADFPEPSDINVNMMPFKIFERSTLPSYLAPYWPMIDSCLVSSSYGGGDRVAYLTVQESLVQKGTTQRRPGLHIERPGHVVLGGRIVRRVPFGNNEYSGLAFGLGMYSAPNIPVDGIYMASTVDASTTVYPCMIEKPHEVTDVHGGIEHMRDYLPPPVYIKKRQITWITDRTPHESMPVEKTEYRQFFRVVAGPVSVWYSNHNTPNPLGIMPNAEISHEYKFT